LAGVHLPSSNSPAEGASDINTGAPTALSLCGSATAIEVPSLMEEVAVVATARGRKECVCVSDAQRQSLGDCLHFAHILQDSSQAVIAHPDVEFHRRASLREF